MITIKNRELLIPKDEQFLGTTYDSNTEVRMFKIDRVLPGQIDISNYAFTLDIKFSGGSTDALTLTKDVVNEEYMILVAVFPASVMAAHAGNLTVQVRCSNANGNTWSSAPASMYILDQITNPSAVTASTSLSELQQLEVSVEASETARTLAETARVLAETGRVNAEATRVIAENGRVAAENARVAKEASFNDKVLKAEGYSVGKQNGADVPSSSPYYHNNAKYYAEQAGQHARFATLIWENANPSEGFAAQDISIDVSGYHFILVIFRIKKEEQYYVSVGITGFAEGQTKECNVESGKLVTRRFYANSTGIHISDGEKFDTYGTGTLNNDILIPVKIYGIV